MEASTPEHNRMYREVGGELLEFVRWGDRILPITHPLVNEIIGQLVLDGMEES